MLDLPTSHVLPREPDATERARRFIESLAIPADLVDTIRLLVSEVVASALQSPGTDRPVEIRVMRNDGRIRVEVEAHDPGEAAWNLYLVQRLAAEWGVHRDGNTKVWFEVTLD